MALSLKINGELWGWGYNNYGQLGNNSTINKSTPVYIDVSRKVFYVISFSGYHSLGIDRKNQLWGWGYNQLGQLGDNSTTSRRTPVSIHGAKKTFCSLAAGLYHSLSIDFTGQLWSWGYNGVGQLGDNSLTSRSTPVSILGLKKTFCSLAAGESHSLGIDSTGQLWSWGNNGSGQLGDNSVTSRRTPVSILGSKKTFCSIAAGFYHSLGIDLRGQLWSWGSNNNGQLGDNSTTNRSTPVSILGTQKTFCSITAGESHSLGVDHNGQLWGWGYNYLGQLGDNSITSRRSPVSIHGAKKTFCSIYTGDLYSLSIDNHGVVWGWGYNYFGQLGDNKILNTSTPVAIYGIKHTEIDFNTTSDNTGYELSGIITEVGQSFSCEKETLLYSATFRLKKSGSPTGNGSALLYNHTGTYGTSSVPDGSPLVESSSFDVSSLSTSYDSITFYFDNKIKLNENTKYVVVFKYNGNLFNPVTIDANSTSVHSGNVSYYSSSSWTAVSTRDLYFYVNQEIHHVFESFENISPIYIKQVAAQNNIVNIYNSMFLNSIGEVWGWGENIRGQLGDNSTEPRYEPVSLHGDKKTFCFISSGGRYNLAIDPTGQLWGWGFNLYGQLGNNSATDRSTPVSILGLKKTYYAIAAGTSHSLGIDHTGQIWSWGYNQWGRLGDNSTTNRSTPVSIHGAKKTFCSLTAGMDYSLGVDHTGQLWGWGYYRYGILGVIENYLPVSIHGSKKTFCSIVVGQFHSIGADPTGQVWSWGSNAYAQLGDNSVTNRMTPVSILGSKKTFCKITAGFNHCLGIDPTGQIWGWGFNQNGQLGDSSVTSRRTPVSILGDKKTFCSIAAGGAYSSGIDFKGQLWGWGYNLYGQLGNNSVTSVRTPVSIHGAKKTFCSITTGQHYCLGIDYTNQLWSWGYNQFGQLGDNSVTSRRTPVSILGTKKTFCSLIAGLYYHCLGIDPTGQLWSWGYNVSGQLGDNSITSRRTPVSILGTKKTFCSIAGGYLHSLGIDYKGQLWSWGYNLSGEIGDNSVTNRSTPVSILGSKKTFCSIAAGQGYSLGIDYTGQVWGWGYNPSGQLGRETNYKTPIRISVF